MSRHGEVAEEQEEPFEVLTDLEYLLNPSQDVERTLFLKLHQSQEFQQLHDFSDAADPGISCEVSHLAFRKDQVKWNDGDQVNEEPTFQVISCDFAPIFNVFVIIVVVSRIENDDNIDKEQRVDDPVNDVRGSLQFFPQRNLGRSSNA